MLVLRMTKTPGLSAAKTAPMNRNMSRIEQVIFGKKLSRRCFLARPWLQRVCHAGFK